MFKDVQAFHRKFGHGPHLHPRALTQDEHDFRVKFFEEEIKEYGEFREQVDKIMEMSETMSLEAGLRSSLAGQFDSLLDLAYITFGAADWHGFPWERGWYQVQSANMCKTRATHADQSKRGSSLDIVKPEGWVPPYLDYLIGAPQGQFVLIEGFDNTGKSTLANLLKDELSLTLYHGPVPPKTDEMGMHVWYRQRLQEVLRAHCERDSRGVVFDRFHLSDYAYNACLSGGTPMGEDGLNDMDEFCRTHDACLIMLIDDPVELHRKLIEEDNPVTAHFTVDDVRRIQDRFQDAWAKSACTKKLMIVPSEIGTIEDGKLVKGEGYHDLVEWISASPTVKEKRWTS